MASTTLTPRRALRQPWRLDPRAVFGLFLMLVSVGGSIAFWIDVDRHPSRARRHARPATGATLGAGGLGVANVRVDDAIFAAAVPGRGAGHDLGRQLAEPRPRASSSWLAPSSPAGRRSGPVRWP